MTIKIIKSNETIPIRHSVLWPNKPAGFCILKEDSKGLHYGGFINEKLICVASIFIDGNRARLRKFATLEPYQHRGYGSKMIEYIISELINLSIEIFWCDARLRAENFYNRFKMTRRGQIFLKSDVEYVVMERNLKLSL